MDFAGQNYAETIENDAVSHEPVDRAAHIGDLMLSVLSDGLDHPELWVLIPDFVANNPALVPHLKRTMSLAGGGQSGQSIRLLLSLCGAALGDLDQAIGFVEGMAADYSQSPLVQGVLFHLRGLADPDNPKYALTGKICETPFQQMDVLERSSHLCCASWLSTSAGDLSTTGWREVWNSDAAQAIRASVHDGSYRYCNKGACPKIQSNALPLASELAARSSYWADLLAATATELSAGPEVVNLAYDRTCNLSCPSCRVERFAADDGTRARFAEMQERAILPLLANAKTVFVTGSGDPFASKNFRQLMRDLTPEAYPDLNFQIMTNGMLFTRAQWDSFPTLHNRVKILKVSIDAATGPTHEKLRRGARWPVMMENMAFAGELTAQRLVDHFELVFTVQSDNYREMGDAIDLARHVGATGVYFARLTNWGTFSAEEYRDKAVFLPLHPDHADFLQQMSDPRLRDPIVLLGDLESFLPDGEGSRRKFDS
ncbi:radical SAM protein [Sphingomonas sp. HMWF008]|nr:radical SAM protein [Sphingomonas sp. HMWF008]